MPRPGEHVNEEASTLGFLAARTSSILRRRRAFRESDVPAWPRSGDCKSRTGAGGQRRGGPDKSCLAPLEQHVGRGLKSGERFELRRSAEYISREVDPFREEGRVATKTARVCGRGKAVCFLCQRVRFTCCGIFCDARRGSRPGQTSPEGLGRGRRFVRTARRVSRAGQDLVLAQAGQDLVLARQRLGLALAQQETAQRQVESAQEQVATAQQQVAMALQTGNAEEVQEAKKEVQEAKKEVQEARKEVQEAKKEVQEAKKEGQEAKKEVQEAKASKTEARPAER